MTDKPIKATLDSSDDSVKTQKPILIQLDDIPTPTDADAGKVLGVDEDGKYELVTGSSELYQHIIKDAESYSSFYITIINSDSTPFDITTLAKYLSDNGFTTTGKYLPVKNITITNSTGVIMIQLGIYSAGTTISIIRNSYTPVIADSTLTFTSSSSPSIMTGCYDTVVKI